jgi:hypothetical protein
MSLKLVKDRCYHVEGWKQGTQFRLLEWDDTTATIQRPLRGGKKWHVPISKLRNTKRHGANKLPVVSDSPAPQATENPDV